MNTHRTSETRPGTGMIESILLQLPLRVALGGVFVYAASNKIPAIQSFAEAIKGFQLIDSDARPWLIITAAFVIPWFELLAGLLLIVGLRARAAALGLGLLLVMFIAALLHVIFSDVNADCSCFGDQNLVCGSAVGWCQVIRNLVLLVPAAYLLWRGPGRVSIDRRLARCDQSTNIRAADASGGDGRGLSGEDSIRLDVDADASGA